MPGFAGIAPEPFEPDGLDARSGVMAKPANLSVVDIAPAGGFDPIDQQPHFIVSPESSRVLPAAGTGPYPNFRTQASATNL